MLTALAHETLRLYAEDGLDVPAIADVTGQQWLAVGNLINLHADRSRTKAKRLLNELAAPSREAVAYAIAEVREKQGTGPLVEPIAKAKPAPKPAAPNGSACAEIRAKPATPPKPAPAPPIPVTIDDLESVGEVIAIATSHPDATIRDKGTQVADALAALRRDIIQHRRNEAESAARARIAQLEADRAALEAELADLRQQIGAAA